MAGRNEFYDDRSIVTGVGFNGGNVGGTVPVNDNDRYQVTEPIVDNGRPSGVPTFPMSDANGGHNPTEIADQISVEGKHVVQTVGWLVSIKGAGCGVDYHLHNGYNSIGNNEKLDIYVNDRQVSHEAVAAVAYDNKSRTYTLVPSWGSKNIVYCNGVALYMPQKLNIYDVIALGETELMFVPLCGEKFEWTDIEKEKEKE